MVIELLIATIAVAITSAATTRSRDPTDAYGVVLLIYGVLAVLGVGALSELLGPTSSPDILSLSLGAIGLFLGTQATVLLAARIHGVHFALASHKEQEPAAQNVSVPTASHRDSDG